MTEYYSIILARDQTRPYHTTTHQTRPNRTTQDHPYNPDRYGLANLTTLTFLTKSKNQE